jgi:hypothetical protein
MRCIHAVCEYFNYKAHEVFQMSAVDFLLYLNYVNADRREQDRQNREQMAKLKARR